MAPHTVIICLLFSVPLIIFFLGHGRRRSSGKLPPGPRQLPVIGNLHQLGAAPHVTLTEMAAEHGPLMLLRLGSVPTLVISSSDAAREVIKHHDLAFSGRPALFAAKKLTYGLSDVAFAPPGGYWRMARKVIVVELLSAKRVQSFRMVREEEVARVVDSIRERSYSSPSSPVDLSKTVLSMANSIVCRAAFGNKHGGDGGGGGGVEIYRVLAEAQDVFGGFCTGDFFPWMRWIHALDGLQARVEKVFKELDSFYNQVIEEHLKQEPSLEHVDMVHVLLRLLEDPTHRKTFSSMNHIKGLLTDIFIAGTDTSAATTIWAMTALMRNPRVMNRVQKEIRCLVGEKGKVEESDLQNLHYLKMVINETFRLHAPVPLLVPRETTETCVVGGYEVPARTRVFINAKAIGRDPLKWGDDAAEFSPERFSDNEIDFTGSYFDFVPFGVGRRICPGINFGVVVVQLILANLLYCFDWELPPGMKKDELDLEESFGITMHKKLPLCLVAKPYN